VTLAARRPEAALPLAGLVGAQGLPRHIQAVLLPSAVQPAALLPAPGEAAAVLPRVVALGASVLCV
jgi:hypothetical protein